MWFPPVTTKPDVRAYYGGTGADPYATRPRLGATEATTASPLARPFSPDDCDTRRIR
jgi:hypothetical protein